MGCGSSSTASVSPLSTKQASADGEPEIIGLDPSILQCLEAGHRTLSRNEVLPNGVETGVDDEEEDDDDYDETEPGDHILSHRSTHS